MVVLLWLQDFFFSPFYLDAYFYPLLLKFCFFILNYYMKLIYLKKYVRVKKCNIFK